MKGRYRLHMNIRNITESHYEDSLNLSEFAFQYTLTEADRAARRAQFRPEEKWGAFDSEKLLAQYTLLPLQAYVNGKSMAMGGIAGVSTWPEYRRQGLVTKLLLHSLETMRAVGLTFSMLHPFEFGFYRKFGWEQFSEYRKYSLTAAQLPKRVQVPGSIERLTKQNSELLSSIYEPYASRYNGTLMRSADWWEHRIYARKIGQAAIYRSEGGEAQGYIIYEVKESKMTIHELVHWNATARQALWTFIANHDSMAKEFTLIAPADDDFVLLLEYPRIKQEIVPYFMARIVDIEAFVSQYSFAASTDAVHELCIQVEDPHAAWNNGIFRLRVDADGKGTVHKVGEPTAEDSANMLSTDIQTLSCMLIGYRRPSRLFDLGMLHGCEQAVHILERILPKAQTFLYDFF